MRKRGFTLIELLVVIAIIGILASIVLVSLGGARGKARDAKRESDIRQISLAMEMYYNDNQAYPTTSADAMDTVERMADITAISTYLDPIPDDPGGGSLTNCNGTADADYITVSNTGVQSYYCVFACLENGDIFAASEKGTKTLSSSPTDADNCW